MGGIWVALYGRGGARHSLPEVQHHVTLTYNLWRHAAKLRVTPCLSS